MRISVPGNLLLLGEYAVLEEGGLGLALAVEKRLHLELRPAQPGGDRGATAAGGLVVEGRWSGGALSWSQARPESSPLISAVVSSCLGELHSDAAGGPVLAGDPPPGSAEISIDSSVFFAEGGRKRGFGSSAAVAVALSWALLAWGGIPLSRLTEATLGTALRGHRLAQGGAGSGYDVYASCLGGLGLFTGGQRPSWRPVDLPWLGALHLFRGTGSVATAGAVQRYRAWKTGAPGQARRFLRRSNHYLRRFLSAPSWAQASGWFGALTDLGIWLGEAIGVPAHIQPPVELVPGTYKSLGAGNELGACLLQPGPGAPGGQVEAVEISRRGVVWQP